MEILHLTNKPIYPAVDGGCKAMAQMLNCIIDCGCAIDHVALSTEKHPFNEVNYPEEIRQKISLKTVSIDTKVKPIDAFKSLLTGKSYNISRFDNLHAHEELKTMLHSKRYDLVFLESLYCTPYIHTIRSHSKAKIILRTHNVEHSLWEQLGKSLKPGLKKWYLKKLANQLKQFENNIVKKVDKIFSISQEDTKYFKKRVDSSKVCTVPVSIDQNQRKVDDNVNRIFFVGSMNWQPNIDAANFLVHSIFPKIRSILPDVELHIAGSYMNNLFPSNADSGVFNHGFVEDLNSFMCSNGIMVAPIRSSSGVRIKMLEAMSLGIPIVTFPEGALGIEATHGLCIVTNESQMMDTVIGLIQDVKSRRTLGEQAWNFVGEHYTRKQIVKQIRDEFKSI
ncbi:MAG: glycosyltransferase family 4 protein [Cryomorphaceae bacterium]|jgi:glycosyltransferase involved in cell wall biosynthesis|nr:glycosyltransferase family 4 protein [Cryomorphaceae bacterium]